MEYNTFSITLISPALLSAANSVKADPNGLRGSSLRGVWRFWGRALWKGLCDDLPVSAIKELENELFGTTRQRAFRMKIENVHPGNRVDVRPLPHKHFKSQAIDSGSSYRIILYWPLHWDNLHKKKLASIIVLWSLLGGIGQRCRRGFGSVRLHGGSGWFEMKKLLYTDDTEFPQYFTSPDKLHDYLQKSVKLISNIQIDFMRALNISNTFNDIDKQLGDQVIFSDMFTLKSLHQISVGHDFQKPLFMWNHQQGTDSEGVLFETHGRGENDRNEHGEGRFGRLASPIYIRLHKSKNGYIPVATISYRKRNGFSKNFQEWLQKLGVDPLISDKSNLNDINWEIPEGIKPQPPKRSKNPKKHVPEQITQTPRLKEVIDCIGVTQGVDSVDYKMGTFEKKAGQTLPPDFEAADKMKIWAGAEDGKILLHLNLTCKIKEQWYHVYNKIKERIERL